MNKKLLFIGYIVMFFVQAVDAAAPSRPPRVKMETALQHLQRTNMNQTLLPSPYNIILTQPLMTTSLSNYYQRTPIIHVINAKQDKHQRTYTRMIIMVVDKDKVRNNPHAALAKKESITVEWALITINFAALPKKIVKSVLSSDTPFGQLIAANGLKIYTKNRTYFSTKCNKMLESFLHCTTNTPLYGRANTLVSADKHQWLAQVIEVLASVDDSGLPLIPVH